MPDVDAAFVQDTETGLYDLEIAENGDLLQTKGFDTSLLRTILGEQRADESEIAFSEYRGGWIGNTANEDNFEDGSKFWIKFKSRRDQESVNLMSTYLRAGMQWLIDDNHAKDVEVSASLFGSGGVRVDIEMIRDGSLVDSNSFTIWDNTEFLKR